MLTWELIGAVVGAGLASGREIASFFSRYGQWSYMGILLAVGALILLAGVPIPPSWRKRWPERLWQCLLILMVITTGGAMISAAGEVFVLVAPIHSAYWSGMLLTLLLAWFLACRSQNGLASVSRMLLILLGLLLFAGFTLPPIRGAVINQTWDGEVLWRGAAYGGFNAALQWPLAKNANEPQKRHAVFAAGFTLLIMLLLGNGLLHRHAALVSEAMPFLRMLQPFGKAGYALCAASLYLAILSTLTACIRSQRGRWLSLGGMVIVSLLGFSGVVDALYPLLGICCMLMLLIAKITNYTQGPFLSRKDML